MVAELLARAHNFTQAKRQAESVLSRWPDDKTGTLLLAESEIGLQDYKRGQALVNEVLAAEPNNVTSASGPRPPATGAKNFPQAEATLRRAWQLDPKSVSAVALLSATYEGQGDLQDCRVRSPGGAASKCQRDFLPVSAGGFLHAAQKVLRRRTALQRIQETAKDQPQSPYHDVLAQFYLSASRLDDAEAEYKRLVQADPKDWRSWHGLAVVYLVQGRYEDAIHDPGSSPEEQSQGLGRASR